MLYDGFLGYVDDFSDLPRSVKDCIDKFLQLPKNMQNLYYDMYRNGKTEVERLDECNRPVIIKMEDWVKIALDQIDKMSTRDATNYAINKSVENMNAFKAPVKEEDNDISPVNTTSEDPITWDEFFMGVAELAAKRSKDPNTKVGAVIVRDNHILSTGYNGMPYTLNANNDKEYPWERGSNKEDSKYSYVVHAELNAILSSPIPVTGSTLYVTLNCCNECAKAIVQSGIKKVIYLESRDDDIFKIGNRILSNAGVLVTQFYKK